MVVSREGGVVIDFTKETDLNKDHGSFLKTSLVRCLIVD